MMIRPEAPGDFPEIRSLHLASFPDATEADLVERLRDEGDAVISLVAMDGGVVVGHVMFFRMTAHFKALGMAPVAVLPDRRKQGVAATLIQTGIAQAREDGWEGIFVLGEPDYYTRFGFSAELAEPFQSIYAGPYLMALRLQGKALPAESGQIDYAPAFDGL